MENVEKHGSSRLKLLLIMFVAVILIAIIVIYVYLAGKYKTHFFNRTVINGMDVSDQSIEEVDRNFQKVLSDYQLRLIGRGGDEQVITGSDIALAYTDNSQIKRLMADQNPYVWIKGLFKKTSYVINEATTYDESKLKEKINALKYFKKEYFEKPQDAYIERNGEAFRIVPEREGNKLDKSKASALITAAVDKGESVVDLDKEDCYLKPKVYAESLTSQLETMDKISEAEITINFGSRSEELEAKTFLDWVSSSDGSVVISDEGVLDYVTHLAYKYDTFGLEREFTKQNGEKITLAPGGDYGWCIDRQTTASRLKELLFAGEEAQLEPEYIFKAMSREENDVGGTYVEVDLAAQKLWCFKDFKLVITSDVVTGSRAKGLETPPGCYAVDAKKTQAILKGEDYTQPVDWWMPFNGDIGLHDAEWRSSFGGEIYKNGGSHGCVNLPPNVAETIFNTIEIGTAVVLY